MDTQHDNALAHALAAIPAPVPPSGVVHLVIPHTSRFTVVGNHLAQHADLSLVAIGVGVHIQSLPAGTEVGIKALAARFPEGEVKIARALRELEAHGYLRRTRVRLTKGRVATRTVFCNQPGAVLRGGVAPVVGPAVRSAAPAPALVREHVHVPEPMPVAVPEPTAVPEGPRPVPEPVPVPEAARPPVRLPLRTAPTQPRRLLPHPQALTPELRQAASAFLADLRRHAEELVLSEEGIEELVPAVAAWLERDATTDAIRRALTADLPKPLKHPARLLRHRLTALLPPPLPGVHDLAQPCRAPVTPFQTCDGCERAFRSHDPGHCRDCRAQYWEAA
ncbi:hypothetical protein G6W57_35770 [Streptomyces sp. CAI-121]|uniref:hypothetical protein n=1 Tax=unclassified Streptomyces TaxID=2593676 RepID=UPI001587161A|nr:MULTISPECIES: hypothetical protein [unclassified Streptomyces]NUV72470.1 hypothetical protein [Streptomyces sp. CAI-121]NUW18463.1 hypothetical protein [Streptomyces sp. CAI-68]